MGGGVRWQEPRNSHDDGWQCLWRTHEIIPLKEGTTLICHSLTQKERSHCMRWSVNSDPPTCAPRWPPSMEWGIKPEAKRIRRVPLPGFLAAEGLIWAHRGVPMETERCCRSFFSYLGWLSHRMLEEFSQESEGRCSPAKHCEKRSWGGLIWKDGFLCELKGHSLHFVDFYVSK